MQDPAETDLFLSLTPEKVLAAVEAGGLECNSVCYPLNSFENRVYEVELADRSRVVAKFYRPGRWSEEQILEEHQFLAELAGEEIPVCTMRAVPRRRHAAAGRQHLLLPLRPPRRARPRRARRGRRPGGSACWSGGCTTSAPRRRGRAPAAARRRHLHPRRTSTGWRTHEVVPPHLRERYFDTALADRRDRRPPAGRRARPPHPWRPPPGQHPLPRRPAPRPRLRRHGDGPGRAGPLARPARPRRATRQGLRERFLEGYVQFRDFDRATLPLIETAARRCGSSTTPPGSPAAGTIPPSPPPGRTSAPPSTGSARPRISRSSWR